MGIFRKASGMGTDRIELKAYGKINLSLDVLGKRPDGYHDIRSFMQDIDLYDTVNVVLKKEKTSNIGCFIGNIAVDFCIDKNTIPGDKSNLAVRGANAVIEAFGGRYASSETRCGFDIRIEKNIPVAAGLAGGSGNAAAVMLAINCLAGNILTLDELMRAGTKVGADVPFSIMMNAKKNEDVLKGLDGLERAGSAAVVTGIGEIVDPKEPIHRSVILANPGIAVSTKEVYDAIDEMPREERTGDEIFYNIMEGYTLSEYDEAEKLRAAMKEHLNAETVLMSGSGPTMVAYYNDENAARSDYQSLERSDWFDPEWHAWFVESGGGK